MVDWGGNYPPGAKNDPRAPYNQPDRSHEHRWRHEEEQVNPVIEDGAAIFHEECQYAEGRHGEGWQCEETRTYRFEYSTLESPSGIETELHDITDWEHNADTVRERIINIEEAFDFHGPGDEVSFDVDPDPDAGVVTIEYKGWILTYEP